MAARRSPADDLIRKTADAKQRSPADDLIRKTADAKQLFITSGRDL